MTFIKRDLSRNEDDGWIMNVQPRLSKFSESMPQYDGSGVITGWKIQNRFE